MRRVSLPLALTTVALVGIGCSTSEPTGDGPVEMRPEADAAGHIAFCDELGGRDIVSESSGPWVMRRSGGGGVSATSRRAVAERAVPGSDGGGDGSRFTAHAELDGGDALGKPTPGAPVPAESTSMPTDGAGAGAGVGADREAAPARVAPAKPAAVHDDRPRADVGSSGSADVESLREAASRSVDAMGKARGVPAQQLKAGATDDNADYEAYLEFLASWVDQKQIQQLYHPMDVSDRRHVRVVDANGDPVPGAVVSVIDEAADRVLWTATTYGDGRVPVYPILAALPTGEGGELIVEAYVRDDVGPGGDSVGGVGARVTWDGTGTEIQITLPEPSATADPVKLDVCFVIDTTGSMGDEIASIKAALLRVTEKLRGLGREFDLRYAAVLYRDIGDEYVTATHAFTADIEAFDEALRGVSAAGGGDGPESLNQAVAQAVDGVSWRPGAAKVAFLIADAPPHMDYVGDVSYGESARAALAKGIRIHSVAASGLDPVGTLVFRQIAQFTRGKFIFIEYGTPEASAASHGVEGAVKSDNLEDILFAQLRDEVATFGRAAAR